MTKKKYKIAVRFEIQNGRIVLFDKNDKVLPGKGTHLKGNLQVINNRTATLEGMPESIGGYCWLDNLPMFKEKKPKEYQPMFSVFLSVGYVFADGILTRKKSQRKLSASLTLYKTEKLGFKKNAPVVFVASDGENFAHGDTSAEAILELEFKTGKRDVSEFKNMSADTVKTPEEWALIYRMATGACQYGTKEFMSRRKLKKQYTLAEILKETKGAYGHEKFASILGVA